MDRRSRISAWLTGPTHVAGLARGDIALGSVLSLLVIAKVASQGGHPVVLSEGLAVAMTAPVIWRRSAPVQAAFAAAAGATLNGLLIGSVIRCIAAVPAVLLLAYSGGLRLDRSAGLLALALCIGDVAAQAAWDPALGGMSAVIPLGLLSAAMYGVGRLVRSRNAAAATLRERGRALREQREATAAMAVAADRARVAEELGGMLNERITELAEVAASGREAAIDDPESAAAVLSTIEHGGRQTLAQMREVVGSLRDEAPVRPQPALAQLQTLLGRATTAETRLHVEGDARTLPAGVELSAYRIVEHLLAALEDAPQARIEVRLRFTDDALELSVSGPPAGHSESATVLAAVRERVALHGGTLRSESVASRLETVVRLPLVTAHG